MSGYEVFENIVGKQFDEGKEYDFIRKNITTWFEWGIVTKDEAQSLIQHLITLNAKNYNRNWARKFAK